jgi:hypothetical protein
MPLSPDEIVKLPTEVMDLIAAIKEARAVDGDGGTKITRAEKKLLLTKAARLVWLLTTDALD